MNIRRMKESDVFRGIRRALAMVALVAITVGAAGAVEHATPARAGGGAGGPPIFGVVQAPTATPVVVPTQLP